MKIQKICSKYYPEVVEIFFESSGISQFKDQKHQDDFRYKYLDYYLKKFPELFFVMVENQKILGYVCGAYISSECEELYEKISHYQLFSDLYSQYPAHLHINTHHLARGKGIGAMLLKQFIDSIRKDCETYGVHIITSATSRNVNFYLKNGFSKIEVRDFNNSQLLMMGLKAPCNVDFNT